MYIVHAYKYEKNDFEKKKFNKRFGECSRIRGIKKLS